MNIEFDKHNCSTVYNLVGKQVIVEVTHCNSATTHSLNIGCEEVLEFDDSHMCTLLFESNTLYVSRTASDIEMKVKEIVPFDWQ